MRAVLLITLFPLVAYPSGISIVVDPLKPMIGDQQYFAIIERLQPADDLYRIRIIVPKASGPLPLSAISLRIGEREAPLLSTNIAVALGTSPTVEASFEISGDLLQQAVVSAAYANYHRSTAAQFYEFILVEWVKRP